MSAVNYFQMQPTIILEKNKRKKNHIGTSQWRMMLRCEEASARNFFVGREEIARELPAKLKSNSKRKKKIWENWMPQPNLACVWMFNLCVLLYDFIFSLRVATRFNTWWSERGDRDREGRDGLMCEFLVCVWFFFVLIFMKRGVCFFPQQFTLCVRTLRKTRTPTLTLTSLRSVAIIVLVVCFFK